ncbi:alpha-1 2-mannosidase [Capsulimonas corticalis]|uniref:Alpha-1 2-mannosidase n=1 Tax=Capsulimonas corticalis TaxID=2219043 RepID=A0A402D2K0_9BACT|nr:GH92 family glycosyl hydrolase [Capsulimonas corticalis]BDI29919.1 alpha-1 2-mannosidase [Capsulimonas corticalis]
MTFNPLLLVNPLQGANSQGEFSRGNTLPLVSAPWGMTQWTLQNGSGRWFFDPNTPTISSLRATRQPSPWMADYGVFGIFAQTGDLVASRAARAVRYNPEDLSVHPDYLSVVLADDGTRMEMSATERCGIFRFTYAADVTARVLIDANHGARIHAGENLITGLSRTNHGGVPENFACYFAVRFDRPFTNAFVTQGGAATGQTELEGEEIGVVAEFEAGAPVVVKIGASFISVEQAIRNIDLEIGNKDFDAVRGELSATWSDLLGRIEVEGGTTDQNRTFYSCLYRAHLFPHMFHETDAAGQTVHYSAYTGEVLPGVAYTDSGFWDTYRTLFPLLSILQPKRYGEILQGFVNAYKEGGWLPQWPSPGYRAVMIGTHIDAVFADAFVKGVTGFDREMAYEGLLKDANIPGDPHDLYGRVGLDDYLKLGYVAAETANKSASRSLDYHYDDFCISQVAGVLGRTTDQDRLRARARNYTKLYDAESGFVRGRNADGSWPANFNPYSWGGPYVEGSAWQSTWAVPHDPAGLMAVMGGQEALVRKLDRMMYQSPKFEVGSYGQEIHEMSEMAAVQFGQYAQSNQPVHLALFLYAAAGSPARTQYWVRRTMNELYTPDDFPGDEDNGEMASWYLFNALGLYPLCPGHPSYVLSSPLFPKATVTLEDGKKLVIEALANSAQNCYVTGVAVNGAAHPSLSISHDDIAAGGSLTFTMAAAPSPRALSASDLPYSLSAYPEMAPATDPFGASLKISCGGSDAGGEFADDCYVTGGEVVSLGGPGVYASARRGAFQYALPLPALPEGQSYTVRLRFAASDASEFNGRVIGAGQTSGERSVDPNYADGVREDFSGVAPSGDGLIRIETAQGALSAIEIFAAG